MATFINEKLREIYFDPGSPGGLGGVQRLYKEAKKRGIKVTLKETKDFLAGQETYSLFKPVIRRFKRNPIIVKGINKIWSADLMDVTNLATFNDDIRYLLVTIDNFTKRIHLRLVKKKDGVSIARAFDSIFEEERPTYLATDMGGEFLAKPVQAVLRKYDVKHFTTKNTETKCSISERFFLTLRTKLHKFLHSRNTLRYIDDLPAMVKAYETSYHRSIKMKPIDVNEKNEKLVYRNLYHGKGFQIGDLVKLSKQKGIFDRGYHPNWTTEEFKIDTKKKIKKYQCIPLSTYKMSLF